MMSFSNDSEGIEIYRRKTLNIGEGGHKDREGQEGGWWWGGDRKCNGSWLRQELY